MAEHTPTPWFIDGLYVTTSQPPSIGASIADCGKSPILDRGTKAANAAFIVKTVNAHDMLVKTLEGIAEFCSGDDTTLGALHRLVSIRNTALNILGHVGHSTHGDERS